MSVNSLDIQRLFSLEGKVALVTGGSRGIGYMISQGLLQAGARVYITARKAEACQRAAAELSQYGECIALPADVASNAV
jgi:NAD(P)-dependent dehydrogenase (short-subunit alcohol dehydrogenase family)